jgi:hypothetical protein
VSGGAVTEPEWTLGEGGRLAGEQAQWVSAVVGLRWGDHRQDWEQRTFEEWKANNWPDPLSEYDDVTTRFLAFQEALSEIVEREDPPSGEYFFVDVVETASRSAVPLPRNTLDGERDRRWAANWDAGTYDLLE